jgi:hypothetical protein
VPALPLTRMEVTHHFSAYGITTLHQLRAQIPRSAGQNVLGLQPAGNNSGPARPSRSKTERQLPAGFGMGAAYVKRSLGPVVLLPPAVVTTT